MGSMTDHRIRNGSLASLPGDSCKSEEKANGEHLSSSISETPDQSPMIQPAPFFFEEAAVKARAACDYSIKITLEMARNGTAPRPIRVYSDGIYDMFHSGHARQLMQAKTAFPNIHLIVGICDDNITHRLKGKTVMNDTERYEAVRHCRYVDEVVPDAPWFCDLEYLENNKIDFIAHDDIPYEAAGTVDVYKSIKERGMFLPTQRTDGISTTDVIARIVRDYDIYVRRNLQRGISRKELNISYMKEKRIQLKAKCESMMKKGSDFIHNVETKSREIIDKWDEKSHDLVRSFIRFFGTDGGVRHWWNVKKRRAISSSSSPQWDSEDDDDDSEENGNVDNGSANGSPPAKRVRYEW